MMEQDALLAAADRIAAQARAAGADEAEAYVWATRDTEANVVGRLASSRASDAAGVGVRTLVGGRLGHAACSSLAPPLVVRVVEEAVAIARSAGGGGADTLPEPAKGRGPSGPWDEALAAAPPEAVVRAASGVARAMDGPDVRFRSALVLHSAFAFAVASTRGVQASDRGTGQRLLAECRVKRGAEERTGNDYRVSRRGLDLAGAGETTVARARASLGARGIAAGERDVLLDPATSGALFQLLGNALSGAEATDQRSWLAGKVGQPVAAQLLTLRDGSGAGEARAAAVDDEGTPSRDKVLVEGGVLRSLLWDHRSARRAGMASTGNALRTHEERHRAPPVVAPMCLAPAPGARGFEDLVAQVEDGIVVRHYLMGLANANPVSGDFSLVAPSAWLVARGEVLHALPPVTIAGNAARALAGLRALGRETEPGLLGIFPGAWVAGLTSAT